MIHTPRDQFKRHTDRPDSQVCNENTIVRRDQHLRARRVSQFIQSIARSESVQFGATVWLDPVVLEIVPVDRILV